MKNNHFLFISTNTDPADFFPGWRIARIDGKESPSIKTFYNQLAEALDFPDYFGHNLDSLDEMLNDLQWIREEKIVIFISNSEDWLVREKTNERLPVLIDLLEATAEDWKWLDDDDDSDLKKKELRILFEDSPRIRKLLEEQEIPFGIVD